MTGNLSRRDFLRLSACTLIGAAARPDRHTCTHTSQMHPPPLLRTRSGARWGQAPSPRRPLFYGRVVFIYATIYRRPSVYAPTHIVHKLETVLPIYAELQGDDENAYNKRWYETQDGYLHSSNVQPVLNAPNKPQPIDPPRLGEVT